MGLKLSPFLSGRRLLEPGQGTRQIMNELLRRVHVGGRDELLDQILSTMKYSLDAGIVTLNFLNAHAVNIASSDEKFKCALMTSTYLLRDGIGIQLALACKGMSAGENLNGTDFIPVILDKFRGCSVALLGSTDPVLEAAVRVLKESYGITVVLAKNGFDYRPEDYLAQLNSNAPEVVILAMGMPKQELLQCYLKSNWKNTRPVLIVSGGAILSFLTGYEKRAPRVFLWLKLEWFWRFLLNPRRLFKRYFIGGFQFILALIRSRKQ